MLFAVPADGATRSSAPTCSTRPCCSGSPALAYLFNGDVDTHAMAWLLIGSIPGVLIGSHLASASPSAGCASPSAACSSSRASSSCGVPQANVRDRGRCSAVGALVLVAWGVRRLLVRRRGRAGPGVESPGCGPAALDRVPRGAARGDGGGVRAHRGSQDRAEPDLRARRSTRSSRRRATATTATAKIDFRCAARPPRGLDGRATASACVRSSSGAVRTRRPGLARLRRHLRRRAHAPRRASTSRSSTSAREHRTITLPNKIELDTTPPRSCTFANRIYTHISPDGDGRNDVFRVPYRLNEPAHAILLVDGRQVDLHAQPAAAGACCTGTARWTDKLARPGQSRAPDLRRRTPPATVRSRSRSRSSRSATSRSAGSEMLAAAARASRSSCSPTSPGVSWLFNRRAAEWPVPGHAAPARPEEAGRLPPRTSRRTGHTAKATVVVG